MKTILLLIGLLIGNIIYSQNQFDGYIEYLQDSTLNDFINKWLGVPYKYGGKTKQGIDCAQFSKHLYKEVYNKTIPGVSWMQWKVTQRINKDSLQKGDLVFFKSKKSPSGWHVGVYIGNNYFIHSPGRKDHVKISSLEEKYYEKNYKGAGRA